MIGSLVFSLELYGLKLIQTIDKSSGSWHGNVWTYAGDQPILLALIITSIIIIINLILLFSEKK